MTGATATPSPLAHMFRVLGSKLVRIWEWLDSDGPKGLVGGKTRFEKMDNTVAEPREQMTENTGRSGAPWKFNVVEPKTAMAASVLDDKYEGEGVRALANRPSTCSARCGPELEGNLCVARGNWAMIQKCR